MLVLEGLVGLHRTVQLRLFSVTGRGIDLDYHDIEWFALETNRNLSVIFEVASKYCISLHHDPPFLGGPTGHGLDKAVGLDKLDKANLSNLSCLV